MRLIASEAQRPESAGDERRHRQQREGGKRAGDEGKEELHRHAPRRLLRPPSTIAPDLAGESLEAGHDGRAVAFGRHQRGDERPSGLARACRHVVEGIGHTDSVRGKLRLVSFAQAQRLLKEGSNLYAAGEGGAPQPDTKSQVRQGFVEKSNVNSVAEMSKMIEVTRAYTQISAMLQQQGDLRKSALDKLADVPA